MKKVLFILFLLISQTTNAQNDSIVSCIFQRSLSIKLNEEKLDRAISDDYLNCQIKYCRYFEKKLPSRGFNDNISFYYFKYDILDMPVSCYDSTNIKNKNINLFLDVGLDNIIVAYNSNTDNIYRISGFKECDFPDLIFKNNTTFYFAKKNLKSKHRFLKSYYIDTLNMDLLYEMSIGLYNKKHSIEEIKHILDQKYRTNEYKKADYYDFRKR